MRSLAVPLTLHRPPLPRGIGALVLLLTGLVGSAQSPRITAPAPVRNYSLSFFSDEGFHSMHVRGATANLANPQQIGVTDLTLTLFSGDAAREVETVILSPQAVLQPEPQQVSGDSAVRLVRDELELTGEDWQYDHPAKKILIRRDARIVFQAELGELLK